MTYRLNAAARLELHEVIESFARENRSRAIRFVDDLTGSISLLESNPRMGPQHTHGTRRLLLRQFSYVLIYRIDEDDCITIVAVSHQRRRPGYWQNRIQEEPAIYAAAA
jgi:plasmid stabilization system protein ParE